MTTNLPAVQVSNALLQVAAEVSSGFGRLLKFSKGKYFVGDDEIAIAREMIAHPASLARGWVKFADGKLVEQRIGKIADGFVEPSREDLGDTDQGKWTKDATGKGVDPWSRQWYLPIEDAESGELYVFVTSSQGGRSAIGALCNVAGRNMYKGQPVIKLGIESYKHRTFGRIDKPAFPVVSWTGASSNGFRKPTIAEDLNDAIPFDM
jgi:hypothetical protein